MAKGFFLKYAFRNMMVNKRYAFIFFLGLTLSISVVSSLSLWSATSEDLALEDFLNDLDYEIRVRSYIPDNIPLIEEWFNDSKPLVDSTALLYYNSAFFNAEDKGPFYRFWPLDNQDDNSDPVTYSNLFLFPKKSIERIASQFTVRGEFALETGEVLISEVQAKMIEEAMNITVEPGASLNITINRNSPDFGIRLFQYEPINFYNITVRGIYSNINSITMMQTSFSEDFLSNSIIFLFENMEEEDITRMENNGLTPLLTIKCNPEILAEDGIEGVLPKIEQLTDSMLIEHTTALPIILSAPIEDLEQEYSRAKTYIVVMTPVIVLGVIMSVLTTNIIIEKRKTEISILKDKGGQKSQIIWSIILEFIILALIAILASILVSIIIASLIPAVAKSQLVWGDFSYFFRNIKFQILPLAISSVGVLAITIIYSIIKINQMLSTDIEERDIIYRDKLQKGLLLGILGLVTLTVIIAFITLAVRGLKQTQGVYTFTLENTQQSSIVFTLLSIVLILVGALVGIGIIFLNGNMKKVFTFIFRKNAFFINFNFKKSRHRLSSIVIVMIILTTTTFYSAILLKTLQKNEQATSYYNNGSDFRIITQDTNYSYNDTIAAVEGIENVMPVMTTSGQYGFDRITVYGINPTSYSSIGRWLESSFNPEDVSEIFSNYTSNEWLEILDNNYEATIISDGLAEKYHLNISTEITVTTLPIGATYGFDKFQITGIIHSAPGLGLATGFNIELKQTNEYYILVNQGKLIDEYGIVRTNLFFASLTPGYSIEEVKARLLELDYVVEVNPDLVSEGFSSQYVDNYVPDIKLLIISVISLVVLISIIILIINIDFILKQRKQENAIMSALGNTNTNLARMLLVEISVINLSTVITGFLISIPFVLLSIYFIMPFLTSILIIPMNLAINYTLIGILTALYIVITFLAIVPTMIDIRKEKIAVTIQGLE